jgi:hypothetical protein
MLNQRKSSRYPVSVARTRCELRVNSQILPAMLLNESHSGFGVLVGKLPSISRNQRAQLHTDCGWFDCRIVHVMEVVPTKAIPELEAAPARPVRKSTWKESFDRNDTVIRKELFEGGGTGVKKDLFEGSLTILATDENGCEDPDENEGAMKCVDDDGATKSITVADIQRFTAGKNGPWHRLGIRCLGKIARPSEPASSLPDAGSRAHPTQWVKSVLTSVFDR